MGKGCLSVSLAAILMAPMAMASDRYPSSEEIYMLELINRFRANPSAEYARYGIVTASEPAGTVPTDARPPLVFNTKLESSSYTYAKNSHDNGWEGHYSDGSPGDRITREGYTWSSWAENIAYGYSDAGSAHEGLVVDDTVPGRGHRMNMLSTTSREVGLGIYHGSLNWVHYYVQDYASADSVARLCGVVYDDLDQSRFYGAGEGLQGATLSLTAGGFTYAQTTSWSGGAYVLSVPGAGTYTLSASGGGLPSTIEMQVTVGASNVKVDFLKTHLWYSATGLKDGWFTIPWFGRIVESGSWVYHSEHGWLYPSGSSPSSIWLWSSRLGWLWTSESLYPFFWRDQAGVWLWYYKGSGNGTGGWFYNYGTGQTAWM